MGSISIQDKFSFNEHDFDPASGFNSSIILCMFLEFISEFIGCVVLIIRALVSLRLDGVV